MSEATPRIQSIIRKHVHDVRNSINILDLEAVLLGELVTDPDVVEFLGRMRTEVANLEATVKALQIKFAPPRPLNILARDLAQMWQLQITPLVNAARPITWAAPLGPQALHIDTQAILSALRELTLAAWHRASGGSLNAAVHATEQTVVLELREPLTQLIPAADAWVEPLRLVELNGGKMEVAADSLTNERVIRMIFPVSPEEIILA